VVARASVVPLSDAVTVPDLGATGQLAQAAPLPPLGTADDAAAVAEDDLRAVATAVTATSPTSAQTAGDVAAVLAPLLVGGALLAGVLGLSAQERRRRISS
jgi:hypothetical protein